MHEYTHSQYRKLYVNKYESSSSPEIEQLRQSARGGERRFNVISVSFSLRSKLNNIHRFHSESKSSSVFLLWKKRASSPNHVVCKWVCFLLRSGFAPWEDRSCEGFSSPKPRSFSPLLRLECVSFVLQAFDLSSASSAQVPRSLSEVGVKRLRPTHSLHRKSGLTRKPATWNTSKRSCHFF